MTWRGLGLNWDWCVDGADRECVFGIDGQSDERRSWSAASYGRDGEHRVTFNISPTGDRFKLVFHLWAKVWDDAFSFED